MRAGYVSLAAVAVLITGLLTPSAAQADETTRMVSGRVLDEQSEGLGGVTVGVSYGSVTDESTTTVTAADGSWSLHIPARPLRDNPAKDRHSYTAGFSNGDDWIHEIRRFDLFKEENVTGVDVQLERYATVVGSVSPPTHKGYNLHYDLYAQVNGDNEGGFVEDDGSFRVEKVLPGRYRISFRRFGAPFTSSWGRDRYYVPDIVIHSGEVVDLGHTTLPFDPPTGQIEATFPAGTENPWMNVALVERGGKYPRQVVNGSVITEQHVLPGRYKVQFGPGGSWHGGGFSYASAPTIEVKAGRTTRIRGVAGGSYEVLQGTFVNSAGEGVPDVNVEFTRRASPGEVISASRSAQASTFYTGGSFRVSVPSADDYVMRVSDPSGEYRSKAFALPATSREADTFKLERVIPLGAAYPGPGTASASGSGPEGFSGRICFVPTNGLADQDEVPCGQSSSEDGEVWTYSVDGIKPGAYKLRGDGGDQYVEHPVWWGGRSYESATTVTFAPGQHRTIDLPKRPDGGWLSFAIKDPLGGILQTVTVFVYAADDPDEVVSAYYTSAFTSPDRIPVGAYKLKIVDGTGRYATTWMGGTSFATAKIVRPHIAANTLLPDVVLKRNLVAMAPPRITGTTRVGRRLSATTGHWGRSGLTFKRQWYRSGKPITGATGTTYKLRKKDAGRTITVIVTARPKTGGAAAKASSAPAPKIRR